MKNKPKFEHLNLVIEGVAIQAGRRGAFLKMNTLGPMQFTSKLARTGKQVRLPIRAGKKMVLMRSILTFSSAVVGVFLLAAGIPALAQSDDATIDARVATLLSRMTLQDKINIIRGTKEPPATYQGQAGYLAGVPRLGIPALRLADGPPGVLTRNPSIAAVATMGLAATFDPDLAFDNGELIGAEARRLGIDVVLEPFININRDISFGRGYNTFGEDPVLTGTMGASQIRGIQSRGIMAMAKHYVAFDSNSPNIVVDPQTLREVYVAPFANAADAGVAAIMCSYNKINAEYACGNSDTLTGILRHEIGFKGFVSSDWGATHSSRQLAAGQDMEMPGTLDQTSPLGGLTPSYFDISPAPHRLAAPQYDVVNQYFKWGGMPEEPNQGAMDFSVLFPQDTHYTNISDALKSGGVVPAMIDRAASRVLGQMDRFGMLPGSPKPATPKPLSQTDLDAINLRTATEAAVLLKNDDHVLPLSRDDQASLAMIGPGAAQIVAIGAAGERALGLVDRQVSPFQAVRQLTGGEGVTLAVADDMTGEPVPANHLAHAGGAGLLHSQDGGQATVDGVVNFTTASGSPLPAGTSHRWSGVLRIDQGGDYRLNLQLLGLRGTLSVDGQPVAGTQSHVGMLHGDTVQPNEDNLLPTTDGLDNARAGIRLSAGDHPIQIDVEGDGSDAPEQVRLAWTTPAMRQAEFNRAVEAARHARKAIVFAWSRNRPVFGLPGDQDALIEAVAAVNPNTVVVLNISQPIAMPWLNKVRGVLLMWWTGDQGGQATADILLGRSSPGGRLPFTWGRQLADYPATDPAHPERSAAGVGGVTTYSEGLNVGYRWFERQKIKPVFPFGYGLSYSRFDYSGLRVRKSAIGGVDVDFKLSNVGTVAASEVAQVYLGPPPPVPGAQFATKALAGFVRVALAAGETRSISLHIPERRFQYWSVAAGAWTRANGSRALMVGASSAETRLKTNVDVSHR